MTITAKLAPYGSGPGNQRLADAAGPAVGREGLPGDQDRQRPARRAIERDERAIARRVAEDWP